MSNPPDTFITDRLILRDPIMDDAPIIFERYAQDPEVTRYMIWTPHESLDETIRFIKFCIDGWKNKTRYPYVITLQHDPSPIGMIEIHPMDASKIEIGYVLMRKHWGKGYISEAMKVLVNWSLNQPSSYRVQATCDVENIGSARVMEKVGMIREALMRRYLIHPNLSPEPRDCYLYAAVK